MRWCAVLVVAGCTGTFGGSAHDAGSEVGRDGGPRRSDGGERGDDAGEVRPGEDAGMRIGADAGSLPGEDAGPIVGEDAGPGPEPGDTLFPASSWFYQRIDGARATVRADSRATTEWLTAQGGWGAGRMQIDFSIEVLVASATTPNRTFEPTGDFYDPDCDEVAVPVPVGGALEGESGYECLSDGDCHLIVIDPRVGRLFEMWRANISDGTFYGGCLAAWDTTRAYGPEARGEQCSSADAAGFPITPLLFTADEVAAGRIEHAIRFILPNARMRAGYYVRPATHAGGPSATSASAPVYGTRWRLRADYPLDTLPNDGARVVARAMQEYGIALADGGNIALTARSDRSTTARWEGLLEPRDLDEIQPNDFEVIDTGAPIPLTYDCVRTPY
jgi:hypothetical protein